MDTILQFYKTFIVSNPAGVTQIENTLRLLSYAIPGRFRDSEEFSELVYTILNLVRIYHDEMLAKAAQERQGEEIDEYMYRGYVQCERTQQYARVARLLEVLRSSSVLIEMAAYRHGGRKAKYRALFMIEGLSAIGRIILLLKQGGALGLNPPVPPVDREAAAASLKTEPTARTHRSSLHSLAPNKAGRRPPFKDDQRLALFAQAYSRARHRQGAPEVVPPTLLSRQQMVAELLFILRPLILLTVLSRRRRGQSKWPAWVLALGIEATSWGLHVTGGPYNIVERSELHRRLFSMFTAPLRTPLYDLCFKDFVEKTLA
eukprot:Colp12_sorted_trinity150504_noHs@9936